LAQNALHFTVGTLITRSVINKLQEVGIDKIKVTELPVGYWTEDFKELLETLLEPSVDKDGKKTPSIIKDYDDLSKDTNVDFTIVFSKGKLEELEGCKGDYNCNGLEKLLKLYTTNTTTNMHLFDANEKLQKYSKITEIIDAYYETRLKLYNDRKVFMINNIEKELVLLSNKAKYIKEILEGTIDLRKKKREEINVMLKNKGYNVINYDEDYKYLVKMPMDAVTEESIEKLLKEKGDKEAELETIKVTTINKMWFNELSKLEGLYIEYKEERKKLMDPDSVVTAKNKKKVVTKKADK
jgi:DNA topoisomerase-2